MQFLAVLKRNFEVSYLLTTERVELLSNLLCMLSQSVKQTNTNCKLNSFSFMYFFSINLNRVAALEKSSFLEVSRYTP